MEHENHTLHRTFEKTQHFMKTTNGGVQTYHNFRRAAYDFFCVMQWTEISISMSRLCARAGIAVQHSHHNAFRHAGQQHLRSIRKYQGM